MQRISMAQGVLKALLLCLILLPAFHTAQSQSLRDGRKEPGTFDESLLVYYEAFNLPTANPGSSRVDIHFRISYNFFVFVRNPHVSRPGDSLAQFISRADLTMELLDESGSSIARELIGKEIGTNQPERTAPRDEFLQGIFSFALPPGEYTIVFQIDDLESNQQYLDKSRKITLRDFNKSPLELSDVLFIEPVGLSGHEASEFLPVNLGGDAFFGKNFDAYVEVVQSAQTEPTLRLSYSLYALDEVTSDTSFLVRDSLLFNRIAVAKELVIELRETSYLYRLRQSGSQSKLAALIPLNGDQLEQGHYELRVFVSDGAQSQSSLHRFRVRWVHMPRSLHDPKLAVDALEYIASKDELAGLKSMFTKRHRERFHQFWKKRDPTPHTALNEAMAEYYHRVDYAIEHLSTLSMPVGYKTDRGRVYLLYGHPTRSDRIFSPTAPPREIWEYDTVKKRFVFTDTDRRGNYKLVSTENLP